MRVGKTEVKNCAAIVIDLSNSSTRTDVAAVRMATRPGHRVNDSSALRRSRGGSLSRTAS